MKSITTAAMVVVWSAFIFVTVRTVWRPIAGRYRRLVYGIGVRQLGLVSWVSLSLALATEIGREPGGPTFPVRLAFFAFVTFPLCLWVGFYGGRTIASALGVSPDGE